MTDNRDLNLMGQWNTVCIWASISIGRLMAYIVADLAAGGRVKGIGLGPEDLSHVTRMLNDLVYGSHSE